MAEAPRSMEIGSHLQRMSCYCALMAERLGLRRGPDPHREPAPRRRHGRGLARRHRQARPADAERAAGTGGAPGARARDARGLRRRAARHRRRDRAHPPRALRRRRATRAASRARRSRSRGGSPPSPTPSTRSRPTASTAPRAASRGAVETLSAERGRHFDPRVVDTFLSAIDEAVAIRARYTPPPEEQPATPPEDKQITLQAAAATLAISPSRLRRWADEGRIPSVRTAGGHRRFSLAAVRRLAAESGVRPTVRPVEPPASPLPLLAENLRAHGRQLGCRGGRGDLPRRPARLVRLRRARSSTCSTGSTDLGAGCESGVYARRAAVAPRR